MPVDSTPASEFAEGGEARNDARIGARSNIAVRLPMEAEDFLTWLTVERGRSANTLNAYRYHCVI